MANIIIQVSKYLIIILMAALYFFPVFQSLREVMKMRKTKY